MTINFTSNHRKTAQVTNPQQNSNLVQAQKLYGQFVNGERPEYQHDINQDPNMQQLNTLAERYKQSLSIADKKNLIDQERNILYEELEHPELTLARNYNDIKPLFKSKMSKADINNAVTGFNIAALYRAEIHYSPFETHKSPQKIYVLEKTYSQLDDSALFAPDIKGKIENTILHLEGNPNKTGSTDNTELIVNLKKDYNQKDSVINQLTNATKEEKPKITKLVNKIIEDNLIDLLTNARKEEYPQTIEIVNTILKDKNAPTEIKQLAVWGAGKFRSEEGFQTVKKIALDTKEKDIRLREFAIHSTSLYLRQKPDEVRNIMSQIEKDGSIFAPLGRILNDKVNGKYHGQKDREFKYANLSKEETETIKKLSESIVEKDTNINIHRQNNIDKSLILNKNNLQSFTENGQKIIISEDTVTRYVPQYTGIRSFKNFGLSPQSGYFQDSIESGNTENDCIINIKTVGSETEQNVIGHELGHTKNWFFDFPQKIKQLDLYNNALNGGKALNSYAEADEYEYFAEGCEATASIYKPHSLLIKDGVINNTRYKLMAKDPDLYKFVKETLKIARR